MKLPNHEKTSIERQCQPLIEKLKLQYIQENPDRKYSFLVDIYTKWYRDYVYFCGKYKSESPNRIADEFEEKFVRLKIINKNKFDISYMRHTGKWVPIVSGLTLSECLEMIENIPTLHPIG